VCRTTGKELDDDDLQHEVRQRRREERPRGGPPEQVVAMIGAVVGIAVGVGIIVLIAIVVGIVDALNAPTWREVAAERRARWESRQHQIHASWHDVEDD
jgi:hypothetical protein